MTPSITEPDTPMYLVLWTRLQDGVEVPMSRTLPAHRVERAGRLLLADAAVDDISVRDAAGVEVTAEFAVFGGPGVAE